MQQFRLIHRARHRGYRWKNQFKFWLYGIVALYEALVITLSFGFLSTEARADYLFSDFMDDTPTTNLNATPKD